MIRVCNPATYLVSEEAVPRAFEPDGKRIALMSNSKPNVDLLLGRLADLLSGQFRPKSVIRVAKAATTVAAPEDLFMRLTREADLVINGVGD
ncbi:hypothetical protein ACFL0Q_02755 [Thermodesulfobacteriota bacterium]